MSAGPGRRAELMALIVIALVAAVAAAVSFTFPARARVYPLTVGAAAGLLAVFVFVSTNRTDDPARDDGPSHNLGEDTRRAIPYLLWAVGYYATAAVVGLGLASGTLVTAFLATRARIGWGRAVVAGLLVLAGLIGLGVWLNLSWPTAVVDPVAAIRL